MQNFCVRNLKTFSEFAWLDPSFFEKRGLNYLQKLIKSIPVNTSVSNFYYNFNYNIYNTDNKVKVLFH